MTQLTDANKESIGLVATPDRPPEFTGTSRRPGFVAIAAVHTTGRLFLAYDSELVMIALPIPANPKAYQYQAVQNFSRKEYL